MPFSPPRVVPAAFEKAHFRMTEIMPFEFESNRVGVVQRDGEPWFVLSDVCRVLDIGNPSQAATRLDDDEKGIITNDTHGGAQRVLVVSESGLYAIVMTSRKPAARRFRRWVTGEVLPRLRRTGAYSMRQASPGDDRELEILRATAEMHRAGAAHCEAQRRLAVLALPGAPRIGSSAQQVAARAGVSRAAVFAVAAELDYAPVTVRRTFTETRFDDDQARAIESVLRARDPLRGLIEIKPKH